MVVVKGKRYVQGNVRITKAAMARLHELGCVPTRNAPPNADSFRGFYLPEECSGEEFEHRNGNIAVVGTLKIKGEVVDISSFA